MVRNPPASVAVESRKSRIEAAWHLFKTFGTAIVFLLLVGFLLVNATVLVVHQHESIRSYLDYLEFSYRHPLVAALSMLLLGFAWGKAGTGLGLQNLFWPDRWTHRMIASMSITLYFALIGTLAHYEQWTMILDSDDAAVLRAVAGPPALQVDPATIGMPKRGLQAYLLLVGSPMIVLILIPAALPQLFPRLPRAIESASTHHTPDSEG